MEKEKDEVKSEIPEEEVVSTANEFEGIEGFTEADIRPVEEPKKHKKQKKDSEGIILLIGVMLGIFLMLFVNFIKVAVDLYEDLDAMEERLTEEPEQMINTYTGKIDGVKCTEGFDATEYFITIGGKDVRVTYVVYEKLSKHIGSTVQLVSETIMQGDTVVKCVSYELVE